VKRKTNYLKNKACFLASFSDLEVDKYYTGKVIWNMCKIMQQKDSQTSLVCCLLGFNCVTAAAKVKIEEQTTCVMIVSSDYFTPTNYILLEEF